MIRSVVLCLIISTCACSPSSKKDLELEYSDELMIEVMTDLYIAEAALKNVKNKSGDSLRTLYRNQIEEIHDLDLTKFESDLKLLQKDPERYLPLHKAVEDTLAFRSKRVSAK